MATKILRPEVVNVALLPSERAAVDEYRIEKNFAGRSDAARALILLGLKSVADGKGAPREE
jgi:hypothetical protein